MGADAAQIATAYGRIAWEDLPTTGREVISPRNPFLNPFIDPDTGEIFDYIPGWDATPINYDPTNTREDNHDEYESSAGNY